ncbi:MAG TPA: sulfotransferase family protein [Actinomycetota bacterium]|nr:sulfotransferase family protein [Actinomycetota bacterium]
MSRATPILVTGSHRSGSTWVGKLLVAGGEAGYIREPFSVLHRPGILDARVPYWFPYICSENELRYLQPVQDMVVFRYATAAAVRAIRTPTDAAKTAYDALSFAGHRRHGRRPLLKDPIAVFSAEWLAERFGMDVVVQIRHPAAFAGSLKRYEWSHPFGDFLAQPLLMRDLLEPFDAEIRDFAEHERRPFEQAILLWRLIHHAIIEYRDRHPTWIFRRHEDIAADPVAAFEDLYGRLGLTFTAAARAAVARSTDPSNPVESRDDRGLARHSRASVWTWKDRLTAEEIERVRVETEPIWKEFYSDGDW